MKKCKYCESPVKAKKMCSLHWTRVHKYGDPNFVKYDRHGLMGLPEYATWVTMKGRCSNPKNKDWPSYGNRGIRVCEPWRQSFRQFLDDMGRRPSNKYSLDRIDNDGDYSPENCKWATNREQSNNRRSNRHLKYNGAEKTIAEWSKFRGIEYATLHKRVTSRGWQIGQALEYEAR